ncbi:MAG: hypothetical protein ACK5LO_07570 [Leucobacter sp.]
MSKRGFRGLPGYVQEIVLQGLDEEIREAKAKLSKAEEARPVDNDLLHSLRNDAKESERLRDKLTSGQD